MLTRLSCASSKLTSPRTSSSSSANELQVGCRFSHSGASGSGSGKESQVSAVIRRSCHSAFLLPDHGLKSRKNRVLVALSVTEKLVATIDGVLVTGCHVEPTRAAADSRFHPTALVVHEIVASCGAALRMARL